MNSRALTADSIVQIGSSFWLRVPLGKLHNDCYILLRSQLKALLDEWIAQRPASLRSDLLLMRNGRRIGETMLEKALEEVCRAAGSVGSPPTQLRHTMATSFNRGMSLQAIAALFGHRSMRMTMVSARADRTVADEYFSVSERVEARYNAPDSARPTLTGPRWPSCAGRCTSGCSATDTAPDPSSSIATTSRSASPAPSSSPP